MGTPPTHPAAPATPPPPVPRSPPTSLTLSKLGAGGRGGHDVGAWRARGGARRRAGLGGGARRLGQGAGYEGHGVWGGVGACGEGEGRWCGERRRRSIGSEGPKKNSTSQNSGRRPLFDEGSRGRALFLGCWAATRGAATPDSGVRVPPTQHPRLPSRRRRLERFSFDQTYQGPPALSHCARVFSLSKPHHTRRPPLALPSSIARTGAIERDRQRQKTAPTGARA
jgi:hypothetical protein